MDRKLDWIHRINRFVEPIEIILDKSNGKKSFYHYVPIINNLKNILAHPQILNEYMKSRDSIACNQYNNFNSSDLLKKNDFFKNNPYAIQIKLYTDDFQTVNPLGDGRRSHEMTGVYYKINNLPDEYQSIDYSTQLALIFNSNLIKEYSPEIKYKPSIEDLKN